MADGRIESLLKQCAAAAEKEASERVPKLEEQAQKRGEEFLRLVNRTLKPVPALILKDVSFDAYMPFLDLGSGFRLELDSFEPLDLRLKARREDERHVFAQIRTAADLGRFLEQL